MAAARRLSELLQEQQEPFLVEAARATRRPRRGRGAATAATGGGEGAGAGGGLGCCPTDACRRLLRLCNHGFKKRRAGGGTGSGAVASGLRSALSKVLCSRTMRRVLRWDDLGGGGCFSGATACGAREFRRLRRCSLGDSGECDPRAMVFPGDDGEEEPMGWKPDMDVDSSRQLSPVSVLDLHSDDDDESPVHSHSSGREKLSKMTADAPGAQRTGRRGGAEHAAAALARVAVLAASRPPHHAAALPGGGCSPPRPRGPSLLRLAAAPLPRTTDGAAPHLGWRCGTAPPPPSAAPGGRGPPQPPELPARWTRRRRLSAGSRTGELPWRVWGDSVSSVAVRALLLRHA